MKSLLLDRTSKVTSINMQIISKKHIFDSFSTSIRMAFAVCLLCCCPLTLQAQSFERMSDIEAELYGENAYVTAEFEPMKNVRRFWQQEIQRLRSMRQLEFALTGNGDGVFKVTIPARMLFNQNDTTLVPSAEGTLRPFLRLVRGDDAVATLIIAAYTDNNGSEAYLQRLSTGRSSALHRWFARQGVGAACIHSFGHANRVPRTGNADIKERERNRRVSLYFVPNKKMLKNAKKGTL